MRKKSFYSIGIICITLVSIFLLTKLLLVKSIKVEGDNLTCIKVGQLQTSFNWRGESFIFLDQEKITKTLLTKYPCIYKVQIQRQFPLSLKVMLQPRKAVVQATSYASPVLGNLDLSSPLASQAALVDWSFPPPAEKFLVDETGFIFEQGENQQVKLLFLPQQDFKVGSYLESKLFLNIALVTEKLPTIEIGGERMKMVNNYLLLDTQPKVALALSKDIPWQLASLQLILQKAKIDGKVLETVDLRFDKPVVSYVSKK